MKIHTLHHQRILLNGKDKKKKQEKTGMMLNPQNQNVVVKGSQRRNAEIYSN